jgi:hypothetical protein
MRSRSCRFASMMVALVLGLTVIPGVARAQNALHPNQQTELYKLQAAFHRYATVQDPANGDSDDVITQRIRDMLSLWTTDAVLSVQGFGAIDGYYVVNGDPDFRIEKTRAHLTRFNGYGTIGRLIKLAASGVCQMRCVAST